MAENPPTLTAPSRRTKKNNKPPAASGQGTSDSYRAMFLVRGGSQALRTVAQSVRQQQSTNCHEIEYHLVTGEPDVVVFLRGSVDDMNQFFLRLAENLSGSAVVAGQPLSIIPYLMENCAGRNTHGESCWSSEACGEGKLRGFVEVDLRRGGENDFSAVETLASSIARESTVKCVSQVSRWDRLIVAFDGISPAELSTLMTEIRGDGLVLATRTRVILPHHTSEEEIPINVNNRDSGDAFLFLSPGREAAKSLHLKLSENEVDSWRVYGQADIVVRIDASSKPNALEIASGQFPPPNEIKDYRGPERVRVLRVNRVKQSEKVHRNGPSHWATLTIDAKGYGRSSKLKDLEDSLVEKTGPEVGYAGSVLGLNVVVVQIGDMKTRDELVTKIDGFLKSRSEMIRTTTTYFHVAMAQETRQSGVTDKVKELKKAGIPRQQVRQKLREAGYDTSKMGAILARVYGPANKES